MKFLRTYKIIYGDRITEVDEWEGALFDGTPFWVTASTGSDVATIRMPGLLLWRVQFELPKVEAFAVCNNANGVLTYAEFRSEISRGVQVAI